MRSLKFNGVVMCAEELPHAYFCAWASAPVWPSPSIPTCCATAARGNIAQWAGGTHGRAASGVLCVDGGTAVFVIIFPQCLRGFLFGANK
jgi:hypothetical protein